MTDDERFMSRALELARQAAAEGEVPVGAVVVKKSTGEIVGEGRNRRELGKSPLAHAEIIAIDEASKRLGGWRLVDCALYVTLEPCPMCAGAVINSRVEKLVYGAGDPKAGSCGSVVDLFLYPYNHIPEIVRGVLAEECSTVLSAFFKSLREKKKPPEQQE
ncbi:MAG: tRNA adenosine(34) deaminase TadA [Ruminococcus sp.]|nr:tRNA adenosine(34) deaminase TadA [Ruminococcus sp.]